MVFIQRRNSSNQYPVIIKAFNKYVCVDPQVLDIVKNLRIEVEVGELI